MTDTSELYDALAYNPFDFVESCEPECTPERHAYHQGQWDMACRIAKRYGVLPNPVDADDIPKRAEALISRRCAAELEALRDWAVEMYEPNSQGRMVVIEIDDRIDRLQQGSGQAGL